MASSAGVARRRPVTDPRVVVVALAMMLVAAMALRGTVAIALAMGGLAGFSLSGSP